MTADAASIASNLKAGAEKMKWTRVDDALPQRRRGMKVKRYVVYSEAFGLIGTAKYSATEGWTDITEVGYAKISHWHPFLPVPGALHEDTQGD